MLGDPNLFIERVAVVVVGGPLGLGQVAQPPYPAPAQLRRQAQGEQAGRRRPLGADVGPGRRDLQAPRLLARFQHLHGITSLSPERADAARLPALARGHWAIEDGSHYRRDVTPGEDAGRIRTGSSPRVTAALRDTVIHLAQPVAPALAVAVRKLSNCFSPACSLLGLPQLE